MTEFIANFKIKDKSQKLRKTGFFSIFLSTVVSKVITVLGGIILVRFLSKVDYGIYAYINNCYSMLFLLNDFGISFATLQYLTENIGNKEKQMQIFKYSIKSSLIASIVTGLLILLSPLFYPYTMEQAKEIMPLLCLVPAITILGGLMSILLRVNFENKKYGKLQIFTTSITYIVLIIFSIIWGLKGAILSRYVYQLLILFYGVYLAYKIIIKLKNANSKEKLPKNERKGFIKYALACQLNSSIASLMINIDTFLIGYMIATPEAVATYNVGNKIPYALTFLSSCIAIYITPHFVKNNKDLKWIKRNFNALLKYSILGFGIMCIGLIILAKLIFTILFGEQYYDSIPIYIVLMIGLFFTSAIKVPCSNVLGAMRKIKINIITNSVCLVVNFISNIVFIYWFGVIGAAITTTATNIIVSIVYVIYLKIYIKKKEAQLNDTKQKAV